ncbi:MAG: caspase family protein [Bacteroidetes bacterium]|nr:caspase family protein [Bacteroidota bacterium]
MALFQVSIPFVIFFTIATFSHVSSQQFTIKELKTLTNFENDVNTVAFSPDGKMFATGDDDDEIIVWQTDSLKPLFTLSGHSADVNCVEFSADEKYLISSSNDKTLKLWSLNLRKEVKTFDGHSSWIQSAGFSHDSKFLISGSNDDKAIKIWSVNTGKEIKTLLGHESWVAAVAYSVDDVYIASGSFDNTVKIWSGETGKEIISLVGHSDNVNQVRFSPDGKYFASCSDDGTIIIYVVGTWKESAILTGYSESVNSISFSPEGKFIASGREDGSINFWLVNGGEEILSIIPHTKTVYSVAFSSDGKYLASASEDQTVKLWTLEGVQSLESMRDTVGPEIVIHSPVITRGMKVVLPDQTMVVKGRVTDKTGVAEILFNGKKIVDSSGFFSEEISVFPGDNFVQIKASDMKGNFTEETFTIFREVAMVSDVHSSDTNFTIGKYFALIIGIDKYSGVWPVLQNAVHDANAVNAMLDSHYRFDTLITLLDSVATRENIIKQFEWLADTIEVNDNLFIYYSGHGEYKEKLNKGFWVPVDATEQSTANYISNSDIQTFLNGIRSKHTLLVSDACFAGDIFRGKTESIPFEDNERYYREVYRRPSRQAITSGGIEPVLDGGRDGHSVFTYYFLNSLLTKQTKFFDAGQLFEDLKIPVANNSDQTPIFQALKNTGDEGGQFVFIRK